jgi:membrane-bound serine protease (ClpP class)
MEILLNPNIAYLLLVAGIVLSLLALLSPGTGLLEIGALSALLLAGWGVYNLPINPWALVVLLVGGLLFILAIRKSGQPIFLVISILALLVGSAFLFRGQGWQPAVNPLLALVVSGLSAGFFWVAARKALEAERMRPTHDLETLIGAIGETKTAIGLDTETQEGTVQVAGELWSARSQKPIPADAPVRIIGREGFILEVEPENGQQP